MQFDLYFKNGSIIKNAVIQLKTSSFIFQQQINTKEDFDKIINGEKNSGFGDMVKYICPIGGGTFDLKLLERYNISEEMEK
jgi:hypothetical protein